MFTVNIKLTYTLYQNYTSTIVLNHYVIPLKYYSLVLIFTTINRIFELFEKFMKEKILPEVYKEKIWRFTYHTKFLREVDNA